MDKFYYIANYRFPSNRAHSIQVVENCSVLASFFDLVLLAPKRKTGIAVDIFSYYKIKNNFVIKKIFCIDLLGILPSKLFYYLQNISFNLSLLFFFVLKSRKSIIYSRDVLSVVILSCFFKRIFFELHNFSPFLKLFKQRLFSNLKFIVISEQLKKELLSLGILENRILVAPDGFNPNLFSSSGSKNKKELRKILNWPEQSKIILYTGQLYAWKGVSILLEAASQLPNFLFYFIGGDDKDISNLSLKYSGIKERVRFFGHQPYSQIAKYLQAADCLILPNSGKEKISKYYTSPMKLFEYMSSGIPIVAADLPSISNIVSDNEVLFFEADSPSSLAEVIESVFTDSDAVNKKAVAALNLVQNYTWSKRAEKIINFIKYV